MSKKQKLKEAFLANPVPVDFRWDDFVTLMDHLGFDKHETSGGSSHCYFECRIDINKVIDIYRPHPSGLLYDIQIKKVKSVLKDWGII